MQVKKSEIREKIIKTAKQEFLEWGFQQTNMRDIACKSAITVSNIYNYFKNKDELFGEILKPTLDMINRALHEVKDLLNYEDSVVWSYESLQEQFDVAIRFIDVHRDELNLILFKSHGSDVENFKEIFTEKLTKIYMNCFESFHGHENQAGIKFSYFFIHNIISLYVNIINEIIMHNISLKKMKEYSREIMIFIYHGINALLQIHDD